MRLARIEISPHERALTLIVSMKSALEVSWRASFEANPAYEIVSRCSRETGNDGYIGKEYIETTLLLEGLLANPFNGILVRCVGLLNGSLEVSSVRRIKRSNLVRHLDVRIFALNRLFQIG